MGVLIIYHYKDSDIESRGWSGLVYLSPFATPEHGTTIWRERKTGKCIASKGIHFKQDITKFDLALSVENKFNRLVLFRENVYIGLSMLLVLNQNLVDLPKHFF